MTQDMKCYSRKVDDRLNIEVVADLNRKQPYNKIQSFEDDEILELTIGGCEM